MLTLLVGAVCLAAGFGLGRVKNAAKLAAVKTEVVKAEAELASLGVLVSSDVKTFVAKLKAKL